MTTCVEIDDITNLKGLARLAGVGPSAVSNWRTRFKGSFPEPFLVLDGLSLYRKSDFVLWHVGKLGPGLREAVRTMQKETD